MAAPQIKFKLVIFIKEYLVGFMTTLTYNIIKVRCSYVKFELISEGFSEL